MNFWQKFISDWISSWSYISVFGKVAGILAVISAIFIIITRKNKEFTFITISMLTIVIILRIFKLYPFDGTRHITYLAPFFVLILTCSLMWVFRNKIVSIIFVVMIMINDIYHMPKLSRVYSYKIRQETFDNEVFKAFTSAPQYTNTHHLVLELRLFPIVDYLFTKNNPDQRRRETPEVNSILINDQIRAYYCTTIFLLNSEERINICINRLKRVLTKEKDLLIIKTLNRCFECGVELVFR